MGGSPVVRRFRGLEGPARLFVVIACCGAIADLVSLVVHHETVAVPVDIAQAVFLLAAAVAYAGWFHRAYANLPRLGVPDRFVPTRLHDDIWRASDPDLPWPAVLSLWDSAPVPIRHRVWWCASVASATAGINGLLTGGMLVSATADLLRVVAAALAIPIVLAVTARQRARAYRAPWASDAAEQCR
jgi:hypothetical protein